MAVRSRALWSQWSERLGRPLLHPTGKLLVGESGSEGRDALDSWLTLRKMGLRADRMGRGPIEEEWPGFSADIGTVDRLGGVLDPEVILGSLAGWLSQHNLVQKGEVLELEGQRVRCSQGWQAFDQVVLTSGAWSRRWLSLPMEVTRQELVYFDARSLGETLNRLPVFSHPESGFYAIPTVKDGRIKVANHHPGPQDTPMGICGASAPSLKRLHGPSSPVTCRVLRTRKWSVGTSASTVEPQTVISSWTVRRRGGSSGLDSVATASNSPPSSAGSWPSWRWVRPRKWT